MINAVLLPDEIQATPRRVLRLGSTKTRNPESGNGNGITETETETEYGICERRFQAIDLKKRILAMTMK